MKRFLDIGNLDLMVLHETMHPLSDHAETLLQRLLKSPAYGHHLAHTLHRGTKLALHPVELRQIPTGNLHYHIVESGLEEGTGSLGDRVLQFKEPIAEPQFGSDESQRIARSLRG